MPAKSQSKKPKKTKLSASKRPTATSFKSNRVRGALLRIAILGFVVFSAWAFYLNARVTTGFQGQLFAEPARVYARPLALYPGLNLTTKELVFELKRLGYREKTRPQMSGEYNISGSSIEIVTRSYNHWDGFQKGRHLWIDFSNNNITQIQDIQAGTQSLIRLDPLLIGSLFPGHKQDRQLLSVDKVPDSFKQGLMAVEDRNFYSHYGISITGIFRALVSNVVSGKLRQGGSTLTQQLVKNYFLNRNRSLWRKANEAIMALLLEWHFSKDQILEAYINEVFLAQDGARAIHGFGLASMELFGAPIQELSLSQQALLIGMVKGPSAYNPYRNPDKARQRRNLVLSVMNEQGVITDSERIVATNTSLGIRRNTSRVRYPAFLNLVRRQLQELYRSEDLAEAGLIIYSSLDPRVQSHAENSVVSRLKQLEDSYKIEPNSLQSAVVITQPDSGEILAVVGGRNPRYDGFNRALDAKRPVGSLLKPAIYLTALEQGYTLATPISDDPVVVEGKDSSRWEPKNFDHKSHGNPILLKALSHSYNQAAARLGMELGLNNVLAKMNSLGLQNKLPVFPAVLLGSEELSPLDVTNMYGTFAANGFYSPARAIRAVTDANHNMLNTYDMNFNQVVDPVPMYLLQNALEEVMNSGTGRYAKSVLDSSLSIAGKTGTTNDQRDSWFAGYTSDYLSVVWIGRDDNLSMPLTGSSGALRLWTDILDQINSQPYISREPANISWFWVNSANGTLSKERCSNAIKLPFKLGTQPQNKAECFNESVVEKNGWWQRFFGQ